jgi:hypothetical protein
VCGGVVYGLPLTAVAGFSSVPPRCAEATHKPTVGKRWYATTCPGVTLLFCVC